MADASNTPVDRAFQPIAAAHDAFAVYAALHRAARDDRALRDNPLWQVMTEQARELFQESFGKVVG